MCLKSFKLFIGIDNTPYPPSSNLEVDYFKTCHVFIVDFFTINCSFSCWVIQPQTWSFRGSLYYCKSLNICFLWSIIAKLLCVYKTCALNHFWNVKCRLRFSFWFFESCHVLRHHICFLNSLSIFYWIHGTWFISS